MARPPTPEQWRELRPIIARWYLRDQRTARWIAAELRSSRGLYVTPKMLRDRFKAWNLRPKYKKIKNRPEPDIPIGDGVVDNAQIANGSALPSEETRYPMYEIAIPTGCLPNIAASTLEDNGNGEGIGFAEELRKNTSGNVTAFVSQDTADCVIDTDASSSDLASSDTIHSTVQTNSHSTDLTIPTRQIMIPIWPDMLPVQESLTDERNFTDVANQNLVTNLSQHGSQLPENPRLYCNGYGAVWSYLQGPMPIDDAEIFVNPEDLIDGTEQILGYCLDGPTRGLDTAPEDEALTMTLKSIHDYFENLASQIVRRYTCPFNLDKEPAFEVQRIAANAHQAVASQGYSSHQTFEELQDVGARAADVLPQLNIKYMHPRVLTVLLRLIVDGISESNRNEETSNGSSLLGLVKKLFERVSTARLFGTHPVALLCSMPEDKNQTDKLLHHQMKLAEKKFYNKVRHCEPVFVAWEEIYSARVLASLGRTDQAETLLKAVFNNFSEISSREELFAHADACRTLGYTKLNAGSVEQAKPVLKQAIDEFQGSGYEKTENALYTYLAFSWVYRQTGEEDLREQSLWEALELWSSDENMRQKQSAVKFIRELDEVLYNQGKFNARERLQDQHRSYFEEIREYDR